MTSVESNISIAQKRSLDGQWWSGRFGYSIYPRTFSDSNADGVGDLKGIEEKLDYLSWLGISAIWLCPFFPSPGIDCGYDVSDYCNVDPELGTLEDFDSLVRAAHERDIAVFIDIVPNHCSDQHTLFQKALANPDGPERDLFIFRDPAPDGGPPNNWLSVFGGSAWEFDEKSGQYYLHLFYPEQPDFNWRNEKVHTFFEDILRFWLDRGIDGYRIDVTQALYKHPDLPDADEKETLPDDAPAEVRFANLDSSHYYCLEETPKVFERWKEIANEYRATLIGEMIETTPERLARYFTGEGVDLVLFLTSSRMSWEPERIIDMFASTEKDFAHHVTWMMSNHDNVRSVDRFGGGEQGLRRTLALTAWTAMTTGFPFLYNGEELGWGNVDVEQEHVRDPRVVRFPENGREGRDPCRTNMAWSPGIINQGFSASPRTWLVSPPRADHETVAEQMVNKDAPVHLYREIIALRNRYAEHASQDFDCRTWIRDERFLSYSCDGIIVGLNTSDAPFVLACEGEYVLSYCSNWRLERGIVGSQSLEFPPESMCVFTQNT